MSSTGFFAYASSSRYVTDAVKVAVDQFGDGRNKLVPWQSMNILGFKLDTLIRDKIRSAAFLAADVTYPNLNVFYEMGYAIGVGKPLIVTVNTAIAHAIEKLNRIGIFDTIGYLTYVNGDELSKSMVSWSDVSWKSIYSRPRDHAQPLFVLDTMKKTDFRNSIFQTIDNSQVHYRKFDPTEIPRLTAAQAIIEVSSSAGVILPILSTEIADHEYHNLRAAFLLGLSHGYNVNSMAIQYENSPAPLDYRDFVVNSTYRHETEKHVEQFCADTLIRNQNILARDRVRTGGLLGKINLGQSMAENETQRLSQYFIRTAEFARAIRAEAAIVIGRKGSGKSAVYFQLVEQFGRNRKTCIVDLRPASHNLSELRATLLSIVNAGIYDHTIAAFWQYIMYVEILLRIREMVLPRAQNDFSLQDRIRKIEIDFSFTESIVAGDFTSRLENAINAVVAALGGRDSGGDVKSSVTNLMFETPIPRLRDAILSFKEFFDDIVIMIDDLDKGWPHRQVEVHDIRTIRHLIEVLGRLRRDMSKRKTALRHLMFLRSDIYEKLVEQTSDRGKYNVIKVDWSDSEQLRHLLRQRVENEIDEGEKQACWAAINPAIENSEAIDILIECSLRRPRFLIDLCERTLSCAINRGHEVVTKGDVDNGMRQMSLYLVSDFGYELRDIAGTPEDIFYLFIGKDQVISEAGLHEILSEDKLGIGFQETIYLLLWYGFLGLWNEDRAIYIYDRGYDFRRLDAERSAEPSKAMYAINPAFIRGLR